jgi:hypothetical protein
MARLRGYQRPPRGGRGRCRRACERTPLRGRRRRTPTLDQLNCAKRKLSLSAEYGGLNAPSAGLDVEHAHYTSFTTTLANMITDCESEPLGPLYGLTLHELYLCCFVYFTVGGPIAHFV